MPEFFRVRFAVFGEGAAEFVRFLGFEIFAQNEIMGHASEPADPAVPPTYPGSVRERCVILQSEKLVQKQELDQLIAGRFFSVLDEHADFGMP